MSRAAPAGDPTAGCRLLSMRCSFEAAGMRCAVELAEELRWLSGSAAQVRPSRRGERGWTVSFTTPPMPAAGPAIRAWEDEMLAVARNPPGRRLISWEPGTGEGRLAPPLERSPRGANQARSQRALVVASLLRCPQQEPARRHSAQTAM